MKPWHIKPAEPRVIYEGAQPIARACVGYPDADEPVPAAPEVLARLEREAEERARLIAATPDILAALRRLMPVMPVLPYGAKHIHGLAEEYDAALAAARAAIAKAEGDDA